MSRRRGSRVARLLTVFVTIVVVVVGGGLAAWLSQKHIRKVRAERGEAVFKTHCKACHDPPIDEAPGLGALISLPPQDIVATMTTGSMRQMAEGLSASDQAAVAAYLGSRL